MDDDAYWDELAYWESAWNQQAEEAHFWDVYWEVWWTEVERERDDGVVFWWRL